MDDSPVIPEDEGIYLLASVGSKFTMSDGEEWEIIGQDSEGTAYARHGILVQEIKGMVVRRPHEPDMTTIP